MIQPSHQRNGWTDVISLFQRGLWRMPCMSSMPPHNNYKQVHEDYVTYLAITGRATGATRVVLLEETARYKMFSVILYPSTRSKAQRLCEPHSITIHIYIANPMKIGQSRFTFNPENHLRQGHQRRPRSMGRLGSEWNDCRVSEYYRLFLG